MNKLPTIANRQKSLEKLSPLQMYLSEVAKYPLLTPEQEYEVAIKHYDEGDVGAAHRLVTSNLRLVVKIANDFKQSQSSLLDLIQEGNAGLMQAVKKFNPYKGVKLSTYAGWWIRAYILKYIIDNKSQVKMGTTAAQRKLFFNLRKEAEKLLAEYDHVDTKLLAENLDVKESEVIEMQQRLGNPDVSMDAPVGGEEGGATRGELLSSEDEAIDDQLASDQIKELFREHLEAFQNSLEGRDREVFDLRIINENPMTLQEIGNKYGISRERARQIEARIVKKLKAYVQDQGVIDIEVDS